MSRSTPTSHGPNHARTDAFLEVNTDFLSHADTTSPPNTEFPICLDDTTEHVRVKIVHINSCTHVIGLECLQVMLENHSNEQKPYPLYRAEWIPAANCTGRMARNADSQADVQVRVPVNVR
jgi:hypothetical protein